MEVNDIVEKLSRLILKGIRLAGVWGRKFLKIRFLKLRLHKAQRKLDRRMSRLGAEFYSLYRQDETQFLKSLVILQQLKIVQEAESQVFDVLDRIEIVKKEYLNGKEAIMTGSAGH